MKNISYISNSIVCIAAVLLFSTVFALNSDLANDVVTAKYFWFYGAMGGWAVMVFVLLFFKKESVFRFSVSDLLVFAFALTGILPYFFKNEIIDTNFILLALLVALYFYLRMFLSVEENASLIIHLILITTALIEGTWGLMQLYGFQPSQHTLFCLTGSFFNPGPYAGYLATIAPLAFFYLVKKHKNWYEFVIRTTSVVALAVILLVLPASMSRAAWLAAVCGCGFVFFYTKRRDGKLPDCQENPSLPGGFVTLRSVLKIGCATLLAAAIFGIYYLKKDSADGRMLIWKNTTAIMKQHLAGTGLGYFGGAYGEAQAAYFACNNASKQEQLVAGNPEYAFNEYLQIAAEQGIAGLILFLTTLLLAFYKGVRNKNYAAAGALVSLSVFAFFSYPFRVLPFLTVLAFLFADCCTKHNHAMSEKHNEELKTSRLRIFAPFAFSMLLFVIVACCLYNRYPTYNAYKEWKNLKMLYQMQLYDRLPNGYERLSAALADRNDFLFEYGQSLSKTENYVKSNIILLKGQQRSSDPMFYNIVGKNYQALKQYKNAEENFIMAANCVPHKLYPYYLLAKLYIETGDSLKFRRAAEILMSKEPKVQSSAVKEMRDEIKRMISDISDSFRQINEQQTNNEFSPLPRAQIEILLVILQTK